MAGPFGGYADEGDAPPPEKKKTFGEKLSETNIAKMVQSTWDALKLPGDVYTGKVDPMSDEGIGRAADLGMAVTGGMGKSTGVPARQVAQKGMDKWFGAPKEGPRPEPHGLHQEGIVTPREGPTPEIGTPAGEAHMAEYGEQAAQQTHEAAGEITRSFDPQGVARSPEQAGATVSQGMQQAAKVKQQSVDGAFKLAISPDEGGKQGAINAAAFAVVPQNIAKDLTIARIPLSDKTKYANDMLAHLTREAARLATGNQGGAASGAFGNVNLAAIDQMKLSLKTYQRAAMESRKPDDIKATQSVLEAFNNHIDQIINSKAFTGDTAKVKAWNIGRDRETLWSHRFESTGQKSVGEVIEKIIGENKHDPATPIQVGDHLWGGIGTLPDKFNVAVAQRARNILGADSQEWAAAQQQLWQKITNIGNPQDWQPRMIKERVMDFLDGSGKAVANEVFSPQKRAIMRDFANTQGTLDLAMRATGMTGQTAMKVTGAMEAQVHKGLGEFANGVIQGATKAAAYAMEKRELNELQRKFPIIRKATEQWWAEVQKAQKAESPQRTRFDLYTATTKFSQALRKVGIGSVEQPRTSVTVPRKADKLSADKAFGGPAM